MGPERLKGAEPPSSGVRPGRTGIPTSSRLSTANDRMCSSMPNHPTSRTRLRRVVHALNVYGSMGVAHMRAGIRAATPPPHSRVIEWYGNVVLPALR